MHFFLGFANIMNVPFNTKHKLHILIKLMPRFLTISSENSALGFPDNRNSILIMVFTHTHMCVSTVYSVLSPESCEQMSQACYSGGIRTHDPCNSRAVSYQLDYRGCPVARGSSTPMFLQRVLL